MTENMEGENNRVSDAIASQEEAEGIRAGMEMRKSIPPGEMTPIMEDAIALDESRLAQWDAAHPAVKGQSPEADNGEEDAD